MNEIIARAREFAQRMHEGQTRKYTGESYFVHCEAVAQRVAEQTDDPEVIAAAYLHDTLEDTAASLDELRELFGARVAQIVLDLTDHYTPERYPQFNRAVRKRLETARLAAICAEAKLIKLADIEDNTRTIVRHDPGFARVYLREEAAMLEVLT